MAGVAAAFRKRLKVELSTLTAYAHLVGGSAGRLVISLAYFVSVANSLSVADFGLFATASATGVVVSRIAAFGFVSPLYRAATVKRRLIGLYAGNFLLAFALSLPCVALAAAGFFLVVFQADMSPLAFAAIIGAEVLFWRLLEVVCIVNNGLNRFGRAALLVILGSALRALGAVGFAFSSDHSLLAWSLVYLAANGAALGVAAVFFLPRMRLRLSPTLALGRLRDSLSVAAADVIFYLQSELDKLLVLSLGGPTIAGVYAILMRLIDLTAMPVRAFNTMLVQRLMRLPALLSDWRRRIGIEAGIAAISVAGLAAIGFVLHVRPTALGRNVADAAPLVLVALLVPAFRNLVEYHGELLYARGLTATRAVVLALVGVVKAGFLVLLLNHAEPDGTAWIVGLNGLFGALWLTSAMATYSAYDGRAFPWPRRRSRRVTPMPQPGG